MFRWDGSKTIDVTKMGLEYLAVLDNILGKETDCREDGEPIVKILGQSLVSMEEGFYE